MPLRKLHLANGTTIPLSGLGVMAKGLVLRPDNVEPLTQNVLTAISLGYRLFDTSKIYGTQRLLGDAIKRSGLPRSDFYIVTKLESNDHGRVQLAFEEAVAELGDAIGYVDCYIMHWPYAETEDGKPLRPEQSPTYVETYKEMEKLLGPKCRGVGVSNFTQKTLEVLLRECTVKPLINQIEVHAYNNNLRLVPWCQERGIVVQAWAPLGGGPKSLYTQLAMTVYDDAATLAIAEKHDCSVGQIILSWLAQRHVVAIPSSENPKRLAENLNPIILSAEAMNTMNEAQDRLGKLRLMEHVSFAWRDDGVVKDAEGRNKGRTIRGWNKQEMGWEDAAGIWLT